ncbi:IroE protein [Shouchella clausii]|uniref:alpha/beta hydrolase n=1 Tax=Shouchella tritolerans TaxID=2979466 RepID=UPI000789255A|nr:alpha/beta hydrolase-fold protein [Shouchella tritolerans]GIN12455.1 IroE protein [Shouchella clausii]
MLSNAGAYVLPHSDKWVLKANGNEHVIFVSVPSEPAPERGFPVLYLLDGNAVFASMTEALRLMTRPPHGFSPAAVVAIGYETDGPFCRERRFFDYTVSATPAEVGTGKHGDPWPPSGGVDVFLSMLEKQLMPELEQKYTLDPTKRAFFGHSLGGLCVLHTLFTRNHLFDTYIAGSPSIWWKNRYIKDTAAAYLAEAGKHDTAAPMKKLLLGVGEKEKSHMVEDAIALHAHLARNESNIQPTFFSVPEAGHMSVLPTLIGEAIRFFLANGTESEHL